MALAAASLQRRRLVVAMLLLFPIILPLRKMVLVAVRANFPHDPPPITSYYGTSLDVQVVAST